MLVLIKILSFIFERLHPEVSLFLGRILGRIYYFLDRRHRRISYHNLRLALANHYAPLKLKRILKDYYLNLTQNLIEILYMRKIKSSYIQKYIKIEGIDYLRKAVAQGKGAILTSAHFGNWEIPNIICKYISPDTPYFVLAREQLRIRKLGQLLDSYRQIHGFKVIPSTQEGIRKALANLRKGGLLGMVIDQGMGKSGVEIDFFNHRVKAPTGALKLSSQFGVPVILSYIRRIRGPYLLLKIFPPLEPKTDYEHPNQIQENAQILNREVEKFIAAFPADYLWQFKRFKNRTDRQITILNDSKTGHLRQSEAVAQTLSACLNDKGLDVRISVLDITFKSRFTKILLTIILKFLPASLACSYTKKALSLNCFKSLWSVCPDFVISAGNSLATINRIISGENQSKSIVIMKPSLLSLESFDLAISPRHDRIKPRPNIVTIKGAANLISDDYLRKNSQVILQKSQIDTDPKRLKIGLLLGGDTKDFKLTSELATSISDDIISVAKETNAQILVSSSRRTPKNVDELLKKKFSRNDLCKLLIIANENNIPEAVGGILGLCQIVVVSGESISMVSEAVSSGKYVIVLKPERRLSLRLRIKKSRHEDFLAILKAEKYIYLANSRLDKLIDGLWRKQPSVRRLDNTSLIRRALERII